MVKVQNKKQQTDFQKQKSEKAKDTIKNIRSKSEEEQASKLADEVGLPYIDPNIIPVDSSDLSSISKEDAQKYGVAILQKEKDKMRVAITDPHSEETTAFLQELEKEKDLKIEKFVISKTSLQKLLDKYEKKELVDSLDYLQLTLTGDDLAEFEKNFKDLLDLKEKIGQISTTQSLNIIMAGAIQMNASDVHFEPQEKNTRIRYRIDGVLQDIGTIPNESSASIMNRMKMMSEMKLNVRDMAQDGQFSINIENNSKDKKDKKINIRINIIPSKNGESAVLRLLDQSDVIVEIGELGLREDILEQVKSQASKPEGIILTTGPTGSGKTTTLYSLINFLNSPSKKIITIENPIEYELSGISQTQISEHYSFANGLRAILRQDPDVILVGEIRDEETAETAVDAALTGHLVLSTLHTNSSAGSAARLLEMGIRPSMIISSTNAFMGQRLVRKLCDCKEKYVPAQKTIDSLRNILSVISPNANLNLPEKIEYLYKPKGCTKCHNLGYKGRTGIYEVLVISKPIEEAIMDMGTEKEITRIALENGMVTMAQDGILKAIQGVTTMDEVWRVTGQASFLEELYKSTKNQKSSQETKKEPS